MAHIVNDVHSALNATEVPRIERPATAAEVQQLVERARARGESIAVSGGRHAMGGQQFLAGHTLLDLRGLDQGFALDEQRGLLSAPAGAMWPAIVDATRRGDGPGRTMWAIRQKQTGADALTLGGAIAANAHGRGLTLAPIVEDIEDLDIVTPAGELLTCSSRQHAELFSLALGGYGMFGIVTRATLRLMPRMKLVRHVDILDLEDAAHAVYRRASEGCLYGDFQYAIDPSDDSFLRRGVFTCYRPAAEDAPIRAEGSDLPRESWLELLSLAHSDKRRAFQLYAQHYLSTHGRVYWSDTMQLATYIPTYAEFMDASRPPGAPRETLMITELYVPPEEILPFMRAARLVLRELGVEDIYGTIRAIRGESTSFLPWAWRDWACIVFNLRTPHSADGLARVRAAARGLIDAAADLGGSFYLTYHRWATRAQVLRCYPKMPQWLARKRELDPAGVLDSDWHRHMTRLVGEPDHAEAAAIDATLAPW